MFESALPFIKRHCSALAVVLAVSTPACATPSAKSESAAQDDMGQFMQERGIVEQIKQAGSEVRDRASNLVGNAMMFLGVPYKRGGNSAETGFDCSGFVRAVYEQSVGLLLPRKASEQAAATTSIDKSELQPGDLVFFNTLKAAFSHVGIYVGDGKFVHSPRTGAVVRVEDMRISYWQTRFDGARRVNGTGSFTSIKAAASGKTVAAAPASTANTAIAANPSTPVPAATANSATNATNMAPAQSFSRPVDMTGAY
jgi:NlpC/P60 family